MPGDKFKISADWFTRTQPVTSPAYTRFGEYYDFFFVPYHLLWRYFPQFIIQTNDDNWATGIQSISNKFKQHPYISSKELLACIRNSNNVVSTSSTETYIQNPYFFDVSGSAFSYGALKLLEYLGYGKTEVKNYSLGSIKGSYFVTAPTSNTTDSTNVNDVALNPFPLAAYQKVYNDFYRNSQWESPSPYSYNFDYLNASSMKVPLPQTPTGSSNFYNNGLLSLRYTNYNKDYFLGRLPEKQYGSEALAAPLINTVDKSVFITVGDGNEKLYLMNEHSNQEDAHAGIGVLALRQAEFLQKWKEITLSGGTDYVSQIQKHFGVKPNNEMAHRSTYIGGFDNKFGIDEVVNTNLPTTSYEANLAGKGVNAGHGFLEFDVREHGIIIGVYHMSLLPEYTSQMTDKLITKTMPTDYVIPEMDNVGMQSVEGREFSGYLTPYTSSNLVKAKSIIGYVPRYAEYKTHVDKIAGVFSSSLSNWVTPLNKIDSERIMAGHLDFITDTFFYKVDPHILDNVLTVSVDSTVDTDQFLVNCGFDVKAVRNISRDGLPY